MQESLHVTKAMQSQRKLCIPTQFPEEPDREQFLFNGEDLFERLRRDVADAQYAYQDTFKTPIPILDIDGKLVQPPKEEKPPGKK